MLIVLRVPIVRSHGPHPRREQCPALFSLASRTPVRSRLAMEQCLRRVARGDLGGRDYGLDQNEKTKVRGQAMQNCDTVLLVRVQPRASSIRVKSPRILRGGSASTSHCGGIHDESQQRNQYCLCMAHSSWSAVKLTLSVWYHLSVRHGRTWSGHPCLAFE